MRQSLLAEIVVTRKSGTVQADTVEKGRARRALSLFVQGQTYTDPDGDVWEFGTVMHAHKQAMIGRREVCADEGHVLPDKVYGGTMGCKRCDYLFVGKPSGGDGS